MPPAWPDIQDETPLPLASSGDRSHAPPLVFSVDGLKTFHKCARKYQLQTVRQMRWPSDSRNFSLGQHVHKLMDYQAYEALGLPVEAVLPAATAAEKLAFDRLCKEASVASCPVIASEWGFNLRLSAENLTPEPRPVLIRGRIDRLIWQPESGQVLIVDWKTGTAIPKQPEHDFQTLVYAVAVLDALDSLTLPVSRDTFSADRLAFLYVGVSSNPQKPLQEIRVAFDSAKIAEARRIILREVRAMSRAMAESVFPLPPQCPDRYCPFHAVCGIADRS